MFEDEQVTDDLTLKFVEECRYFYCSDSYIAKEFRIHYGKAFRDARSLRKIYTSIAGLLNTGKIIYDDETGYRVAENV